MTQEEKELLLRDLSARLPYGVEVDYKEYTYDIRHWKIDSLHSPAYSESGILINTDYEGWINFTEYEGCGMSTGSRPLHIEKNLPFLRSIHSMTKKEREEFDYIRDIVAAKFINAVSKDGFTLAYYVLIDWLNAHHFDYRGLIGAGLALEAPEGMYNLKE